MHHRAIGIIETNSIAKGIKAADSMLKAADISILISNPVCPGKYVTIIQGSVASVKSSIEAGATEAGESITESVVIPNVHPDIFPAMTKTTNIEKVDAIGIIETFSAPSAIMAADEAIKTAKIQLIEVRLSMALGGKAFTVFTGEVGAVRAALAAGVRRVTDQGLILSTTLIPAPHKDFIKHLL